MSRRNTDYGSMRLPLSPKSPPKDDGDPSGTVVHPFPFQGDDATLIEGMKAKHPAAFRAFYHRHVSLVYAVLLRTLGSDDDLDILISDVFFNAFEGIHNIKQIDRVPSWLSAIAVNTARDTIKYRKRFRWLRFLDPARMPESKGGAPNLSEREAVAEVYRVLDTLSVDNRIAFTLRYMHEMELTEVAAVCGVSLATIKRRLSRARKQFLALAKKQPALRQWVQDE
ncbi:MAG: RNA polymerase sigma factor [Proteobacteria bacterium]|nr:RNA polymerase sigma factor [Pseudomonadota bacterium]